jgi:hypothetical protein
MRHSLSALLCTASVVVFSTAACTKAEPSNATVADAIMKKGDLDSSPTAPQEVLVERDANRVYLVRDSSATYVLWKPDTSSSRNTWRSANTYGGRPQVQLADVNQDGSLDLFWAMQYEDNLEGMIVLNRGGRFIKLIPKVEQCQRPELGRANNRYVYIAYVSGAYPLDDCTDPVVGRICVQNFHANWPRLYAIDSGMTEISPGKDFYTELAARLKSEGNRFDSLYAADTAQPKPTRQLSFCASDAGQRLRRLADSAARLAGK